MHWVLYFAFVWWAVVATLIMTAIAYEATKKPQSRTVPVNRTLRQMSMHRKKF